MQYPSPQVRRSPQTSSLSRSRLHLYFRPQMRPEILQNEAIIGCQSKASSEQADKDLEDGSSFGTSTFGRSTHGELPDSEFLMASHSQAQDPGSCPSENEVGKAKREIQ